ALGAEASFVARSIDSDRKHLQSVMRAAADHRGSSFIEIFQNCPIFNDDAFAPVKEPKAPGLIRLAHGEQVRFGPEGSMGLTYGPYGALQAVEAASVPESELVVHDTTREDPSYAFALSRLDSGNFARTPIGVFRSTDRATYDQAMAAQIEAAQAKGDGDLAALISGNDTWEVS
ncbi:MAG: 2-oxoacid:ferredoxin oxidoreductase subunit beta, partial [Trebonia sp.]